MKEIVIDESMFQSSQTLKNVLDSLANTIIDISNARVSIPMPTKTSVTEPQNAKQKFFNQITVKVGDSIRNVYTPAKNVLKFQGDVILNGSYSAILFVVDTTAAGTLKIDNQEVTITQNATVFYQKRRIEYHGDGSLLAYDVGSASERDIIFNFKYTNPSEKFILLLGYNNNHPIILNTDAKLFEAGYYAKAGETLYFIFTPLRIYMQFTNI